MTDLRRRLVSLCLAAAIVLAAIVIPGCGGDDKPKPPDPNKTTAPAKYGLGRIALLKDYKGVRLRSIVCGGLPLSALTTGRRAEDRKRSRLRSRWR